VLLDVFCADVFSLVEYAQPGLQLFLYQLFSMRGVKGGFVVASSENIEGTGGQYPIT
jgi:hypothetical protein